uniref:Uncharacterized protein n=1 Tax=Arundo donax TaxID=35708 RepID=A0A0A9DHE1_ARUDO
MAGVYMFTCWISNLNCSKKNLGPCKQLKVINCRNLEIRKRNCRKIFLSFCYLF